MQIVISDDGSSSNKLRFKNKEGMPTNLLVENTFSREKKAGLHPINKTPFYSYHLDAGRSFTWDMYGSDPLGESLDFQLSEHSLISTYIGMHKAGIVGDVILAVTVPIAAFFNPTTFEINHQIVEAKREHMMSKPTPDNAALKLANVVEVKVYPECLPFVAQQLGKIDVNPRDLIMGFDQGGSTGDMVICDAGTLTPQLMVHGLIGFNRIINWIMKSLDNQGCCVIDAKEIIKNRTFGEYNGSDSTLTKMIDDTVEDIIMFIQREAGNKLERIKHVFLTGAPSLMLKEHFETRNMFNRDVKYYVSDNPEFALAEAIAEHEGL